MGYQSLTNNSLVHLLPCSKLVLLLLALVLPPAIFPARAESTQSPFACDSANPETGTHRFCDARLGVADRAKDLVARLTVDEKVSQLVNTAAGVPRLGVPAYEWWSEALHGVAYIGGVPQGMRFDGRVRTATSFPQVILTAASFDANLWHRIGQVSKQYYYDSPIYYGNA